METVTEAKQIEQRNYRAGEVILFPGRPAALYRVLEGLVRIHTVDDEGNGLTLRYVKPGGFFGEEAMRNLRRTYFAEAITSCRLEAIDPEGLDDLVRADVTAYLVEVVSQLYQSLHRLSGKRLKSRIAAELLELQDSALASEEMPNISVIRITHDDLAAAVGSVRETVTKVVGELSRTGVIEAGYGKIKLLDIEGLEQVANE